MSQLRHLVRTCRAAQLFRYSSAYIVFAWGSITFVDTLGPNVNAPDWIETSLLLLWMGLFPVFLLFVWVKNKDLVQELPVSPLKALDFVLLSALGLVLLVSLYTITRGDTPFAPIEDEEPAKVVSIGSKTFLESSLLLELFALVIQDDHPDLVIERKHFIGETAYVLDELERNNIDLFGEYTGTILAKYLNRDRHYQLDAALHQPDPLNQLLRGNRALRHLQVLGLLGFENDYTLVMRREVAEGLFGGGGKFTISELAKASKHMRLRLGCTYGFAIRADGLPGVKQFYDIDVVETVQLLHEQKYDALQGGRVDVIEGYTTDGQLADGEFVALRDDRGFWPSYRAAPVVRAAFAKANPDIVASIERLGGQLDSNDIRWALSELRKRGYSSDEIGSGDFEPLTRVARDLLRKRGLIR